MKHWVVWLAAPAIVCLGGCGRKDAAEAKSDPPRAVTVAVAKARHQDLSRELVLTAEFRPFQEIDVHAKVAGFVKKIYVDVGDRVKEGQLLTVLEIPESTSTLVGVSIPSFTGRSSICLSGITRNTVLFF